MPVDWVGDQVYQSSAALTGGGWVVAWTDHTTDSSRDNLVGRRLAADGTTVGPDFPITVATTGNQTSVSLAAAGPGFAAGWLTDSDGGGQTVVTRTFQAIPVVGGGVAVAPDGSFEAGWTNYQSGADNVEGRHYDPVSGSTTETDTLTDGSGDQVQVVSQATTFSDTVLWEYWVTNNGTQGLGQFSLAPALMRWRIRGVASDGHSTPLTPDGLWERPPCRLHRGSRGTSHSRRRYSTRLGRPPPKPVAAPWTTPAKGSVLGVGEPSSLPEINVTAIDPVAFEGTSTGEFRVSRNDSSGNLAVNLSLAGGNGQRFTATVGGAVFTGTALTIPDGQSGIDILITPITDSDADINEATLSIAPGSGYDLGGQAQATVAIVDKDATDPLGNPLDVPIVTIQATDPDATVRTDPGMFQISLDRVPLTDVVVTFDIGGTAPTSYPNYSLVSQYAVVWQGRNCRRRGYSGWRPIRRCYASRVWE